MIDVHIRIKTSAVLFYLQKKNINGQQKRIKLVQEKERENEKMNEREREPLTD